MEGILTVRDDITNGFTLLKALPKQYLLLMLGSGMRKKAKWLVLVHCGKNALIMKIIQIRK